jgi:hypothetical protein
MSASTAPVAKANLLALLTAASALTGVQCEWAHPGTGLQQEAIFFRGVIVDEVAGALGQQRRNESYILETVVSVAQDGDEAQACETRMWALVAAVENVLRPPLGPGGAVSANLGGAVNLWAVVERIEQTPYVEQGQRVSEAVMGIRCQSRK